MTLARDADLLYHEATFGEDLPERAAETGHSTARQAAEIARRAGAKKLILGHFSARYKDVSGLVEEAQDVFQNTEAAEELKRYVLGKTTRLRIDRRGDARVAPTNISTGSWQKTKANIPTSRSPKPKGSTDGSWGVSSRT